MMRRILYLSPYFWPEDIGSAPYCTDLALWLRERGHSLQIVSFRPHYPNVEQFTAWADGSCDEDLYASMPVCRVPIVDRGKGGAMERLKNDVAFLRHTIYRAIRREFKGTEVVIAYVPTILTLYAARVVRLLTGASIVAIVHDVESGLASSLGLMKNRGGLVLMQLTEKLGLNFADGVVVLTEGMKEELERLGCRRPITVLPLWTADVDFLPFDPSRMPVIMYSGNFGKKQKLDQLCPLFKRLSDEALPLAVEMRGDGSERQRLQARFDELGIANATFMPLAAACEFLEVLRTANIHLVPQAPSVSNYAIPSKVFSIMSVGRPFVCLAEPGSPLARLARQSGAGLCVTPGDEEALYQAVVGLVSDPERQNRMGKSGWLFVKEHMNKEKILAAYEELINTSRR